MMIQWLGVRNSIRWNPGSSDLILGLGLFSPFGIGGRKWSDDGLTRFVSTDSLTATFAINPSLAWRVTPKLFIGGGTYYLYARNETENRVDQSMLSSPEGVFELEADGGNGATISASYIDRTI